MSSPTSQRTYIAGGAFMNRLVNPLVARLGLTPVLIVRGRKSGKLIRVPLREPFELDGVRYLVSGRGETHWARNLRAAGRGTLRVRGRSEDFRASELHGEEQERVIEAYRKSFSGSSAARRDRYFAEIPNIADHPVFRMDPL